MRFGLWLHGQILGVGCHLIYSDFIKDYILRVEKEEKQNDDKEKLKDIDKTDEIDETLEVCIGHILRRRKTVILISSLSVFVHQHLFIVFGLVIKKLNVQSKHILQRFNELSLQKYVLFSSNSHVLA